MKISDELRICMDMALSEARERRQEYSTVEHLLFAFLFDEEMRRVLGRSGADLESLKLRLEDHLDDELTGVPEDLPLRVHPSLGFSRVVQRAALHVQGAGKDEVTPINVLVAMFSEPDGYAAYLLEQSGCSRLDIVRFISHGISKGRGAGGGGTGGGGSDGARDPSERAGAGDNPYAAEEEGASDNPLEAYTSDLNARAKEGDIDPLIGRDKELDRVIHVLARRRKNNPMLVGEAGVGKTAIVEGLARKIVAGEVPPMLRDVTIYALDMGAMVAGTRYRGDFEERMKAVMDAITGSDNKSVLFIDEIHTVVGAGAVSGGALDASNMIKPALASGKLRCIGATTFAEHRAQIERDRAFSRRFQVVEVGEPSRDDAVAILHGLKGAYESFHKVKYDDDAIEAAVDLSARYVTDRRLPDKAIDVMDEAGAERALKGEDRVALVHVQEIVSAIARVPAENVTTTDRSKLKNLEDALKSKVFGQDAAVKKVARAVRLARAGLRPVDKPIGSFLFSGPTGVGKTELAKQLAGTLGVAFVRFDMSEYTEAHTISRLIGAPPGYVGFDQGGLLTDAMKKTPHAVLLLDEIEKAHPSIFNVLLQVMDYGTLTDNNGRKTDFRNVILIMTSNVGAEVGSKRRPGFSASVEFGDTDAAYKRVFSPEFRNRLDAKISFAALPLEVMTSIVDKMVAELVAQLEDKGVSLILSDEARTWLAGKGYDPANGARPMARLLREQISEPLSEELLFGALVDGGVAHVEVEVDGDGLGFRFGKAKGGKKPKAAAKKKPAAKKPAAKKPAAKKKTVAKKKPAGKKKVGPEEAAAKKPTLDSDEGAVDEDAADGSNGQAKD